MPLPTYKDYEGGKRTPGGESLQCFAAAGVNVHWLLTGEGPMFIAPRVPGAWQVPAVRDDAGSYRQGEQDTASANRACTKLMRRIVEFVETALTDLDLTMSPAQKANLVAALYDLYADSGTEPNQETVTRFVRSALS